MAPPPILQKLNSLVRKEPWASLAYGCCWTLVLCVLAPTLAVLVLIPFTMYRIIAWKLDWMGVKEYDPKNNNNTTKELAIVVTGCDSGFGKDIALWASSNVGFVVFAGCLNEESIVYYNGRNVETSTSTSSPRIIPILMDVTKDEDVANAAKVVSSWLEEGEKQRVLHALVNNAGITIAGFFDWLDLSDIQRVMDVNYFGLIRCCKAFLPILKQQAIQDVHKGGRIVNLTSVAGLVPGGPMGWNYSSSKHAAQTFTEGLRKEMAMFGIGVTSINPGFTQTPILESHTRQMDGLWSRLSPEIREEYGRGT
jgi:11-cis-retinol dehydrogenase